MFASNCNELPPPPAGRRRIVIVGGGAVGLYAARELIARGEQVVVLEAGGPVLANFPPDSYTSTGKLHNGIRLGRARCLGGATNLWGGQLVEFQRADFEQRDWVPDSKWPVTYEEISAYYQRTYLQLGIPKEFLDDGPVFQRAGGLPPPLSEGLEIFLTRWLKVPSFAAAFDLEIRTAPNLSLLLDHTATGFTASGGKISAVRAVDRAGKVHLIEADAVILAAGTIEISRLLLHAAATPGWDCPWRDNDNVGAYFQDHLVGRVAAVEALDNRRFFHQFSNIVCAQHKFQPKIRQTGETVAHSRVLNMHAFMGFESSISENLVYLKQFLKAALYSRKISGVGNLFKNIIACGRHLPPLMWKYIVDHRIFVPGNSKISLLIQSEQLPVKESRITIDPSRRDAQGLPRVMLNWKVDGAELASVREFTLRCDRALQAAGLGRLKIEAELKNGDPAFLAKLSDNYHHSGGARMGETAADGVVDRDLRVFGTTNLYIIGASTFRTTGNANVTFTALAFTTRLVDHLAGSGTVR